MLPTEQQTEFVVIRPDADIVASHLSALRAQLGARIDAGQVNLAIDLAEVTMIDSTGLAALMMCHKSLTARGGRLVVLTANENFKHLFHVMRLDEHFTVAAAL